MSKPAITPPLTLHVGPDGHITTGHPLEDERLANAIAFAKDGAKRIGAMVYVYEHPRRGLEISPVTPKELGYIEVFPGGRTVFRPVRKKKRAGE